MSKNGYSLALTLLIALLFIAGCAGNRPAGEEPLGGKGEAKAKIESEARPLYTQAEKAFSAKNYEEAQKLFVQVKAKFPRGRAQIYASYRLGIIYYYKEQYAFAAREFDFFLTRMPQSDLSFDALYNLAASEFQLGQYDRAYQTLGRLHISEIQAQGPRRANTVYQLTARTAAALGNNRGAVAAYALLLQSPLPDAARSDIEAKISDHLSKMNDRAELDQLQSEVHDPGTQSKIAARLEVVAASGPVKPTDVLNPANLAGPGGEGTITPLPPGTSGDRFSVGVILPLTGKYSNYGRRALDAILLASKVFNSDTGSDLRLFIRDTNSNPLISQMAVDELYSKEGVVAVIGPLSYRESVAAAERAQELGLLNLSLSSKEGISEKGQYLFQNALTPGVQLENLVKYCISEKHFSRFAILSPNNNFGKEMSNQFWDYVEKYGAHVVSAIAYAPDQTDFQSYIQQMAGLDNPKYRKVEWAKAQDYLKDLIPKLPKGAREPKLRLPPVVDFDAIFIPDTPKTVAQIGPSLAYFDVAGVSLLGTTEWNTDQLYKRGGRYVEGAIFPGGLSLNSRNPRQQEFIKSYFEAFGAAPDLLAAQSFEAMELVATAMKLGGSGDRNMVVNQLANFKDFETPLGSLTFDSERIARRRVPIYTLDSGGAITEH
jgi:branched-chain amino acid transport system substrate-binding protein